MALTVFDSDGNPVSEGSTVVDFRGDEAILLCATRARRLGKSGKVVVRWKAMDGVKAGPHSYYDDGRTTQYEYYDKVFDLHVEETNG